jgi:hypothetical protein
MSDSEIPRKLGMTIAQPKDPSLRGLMAQFVDRLGVMYAGELARSPSYGVALVPS